MSRHIYLFLLIFFVTCHAPVPAQKNISPYKSSAYNQTDSISIYLKEGELLSTSQPLRAIASVNRAIELCLRENRNDKISDAYLLLGNIQLVLGQAALALGNYEKSEQYLTGDRKSFKSINTGVSGSNYKLFKQKALAFEMLRNYSSALTNIDLAIEKFDYNAGENISVLHRIKAGLLTESDRHNEAIELLQSTLKNDKQNNDKYSEARTLLSLGNALISASKEDKGIESLNNASAIADQYNYADLKVEINNTIAGYYQSRGDLQQEISVRNKNAEVNMSNNDMNAWSNDNLQIGNAYLNANQTQQAESYLVRSLEILDKSSESNQSGESPQRLQYRSALLQTGADALRSLAKVAVDKKDYSQALKYYQRYEKLQDSIAVIRKQELDDAIALSTGIGKNEQRIELLEMERSLADKSIDILQQDRKLKDEQLFTRNLIIGIMAAFLVILIITGIYIARNTRDRIRADKLLALQSLSGQMNPHFIFNALNSVNEYISRNDELEANRYLSSFSKLMRQVMDDSRNTFIPLDEELEMLKLYLQLEHGRFKDRFSYTLDTSDVVNSSDLVVPPMIIQPFIENAIWHGLRYRSTPGNLNIRFETKNNTVAVIIADNGIGIAASGQQKTKNQKKQNSLGMINTRNRIKLIREVFEINIELQITETFPGKDNPGVTVILNIPQPKNTNEQKELLQ